MQGAIQVLVVGAGPTGLTAAVALARAGVTVRVIDSALVPADFIKGSIVSPRTLDIFEDLGLLDEAMSRGVPVHGTSMWSHGKRVFEQSFETLEIAHAFNLHLGQPYVEEILTAALDDLGVSVERDVTLTEWTDHGDHVTATVIGTGAEEANIDCDFLAGCDGSRSTVRKIAGERLDGVTYPVDYLLTNCRLDWRLAHDSLHVFFTDAGALTVNPLPDGLVQIGGEVMHELGDDALHDRGPTLEEMQEMFNERSAVPGTLSDPQRLIRYRTHRRAVSNRVFGRVILAGDASHLVSPQTGLGMNTGIQDAWALAWRLSMILRHGGSQRLLEDHESERAAILEPLGRMSDLQEKIYTARRGVMHAIREVGTRVLNVEPLARLAFQTLLQVSVPIRDQSSVDESTSRIPKSLKGPASRTSVRAGDTAPDVVLIGQDPPRLSLRLGGGDHVMLVLVGGDPTEPDRATALEAVVSSVAGYDFIRTLIVVPSGVETAPRPGAQMISDEGNAIHAAYGATGVMSVLIRPDRYIGHLSRPASGQAVAAHLKRIYR